MAADRQIAPLTYLGRPPAILGSKAGFQADAHQFQEGPEGAMEPWSDAKPKGLGTFLVEAQRIAAPTPSQEVLQPARLKTSGAFVTCVTNC